MHRGGLRVILGYNTNGFSSHSLDDALAIIAEIGYRGVAITPDIQHLNPFTSTAADVARVAKKCRDLYLAVTIETGARFLLDARRKHEPTLISPEPEGRTRRIAFYNKCIAIAADLGAPVVCVFPGVDHARAARAGAWLLEGLKRTADAAAKKGVKIALEPEPGMPIETAADGLALVRELNHPALGLTIDVGHCVALGENAGESLRAAGALLWNVHLDDAKPGAHEHLQFGDGALDLKEVFAALRDIGYAGPANVELSRHSHAAPDAARKAFRALSGHVQPGHA
jgi:L-ribulose-5-phosphate 3-epimerase